MELKKIKLFNTDRINHLYQDPHESDLNFILHYGDLTDSTNILKIIEQTKPDEIIILCSKSCRSEFRITGIYSQ